MKNSNNQTFNTDILGQHLNTFCHLKPAANDIGFDQRDYDDVVLELIGKIYNNMSCADEVIKFLNQVQQIVKLHVPMEFRPSLFRQLNSLNGTLMTAYLNNSKIYDLCFNIVSALKSHIDAEEQQDQNKNQMEWEELEKSVYLLCDWEDQVQLGLAIADQELVELF